MKRILLIAIALGLSLNAKIINISAEGVYSPLVHSQHSHTPDETEFARKQAIVFAKQTATEEAGTTIYSSFKAHSDSNGKEEAVSDMRAISSAVVRYSIMNEGWVENKYKVQIKATVDLKDAEEVFEKGDLLVIAEKNDRDFEKAKFVFDQLVMEPFKKEFIAKLLNIDVIRHGDTADIKFVLGIKVKKAFKPSKKLKRWVDEQVVSKDIYKNGPAFNALLLNDTGSTDKLKEWLLENRNVAIKINVGKRTYITENMAYFTDRQIMSKSPFTAKGSYDGGYMIYSNTNDYLTHRIIKNVPVSELATIDSMRADLVYTTSSRNSNYKQKEELEFSLPVIKEASEYYR